MEESSDRTLYFKAYLQQTKNGSGSLRPMVGLMDPSAPRGLPEEGACWWEAPAGSRTGRHSHSHCTGIQSSYALQLWPLSSNPRPCPELCSTDRNPFCIALVDNGTWSPEYYGRSFLWLDLMTVLFCLECPAGELWLVPSFPEVWCLLCAWLLAEESRVWTSLPAAWDCTGF